MGYLDKLKQAKDAAKGAMAAAQEMQAQAMAAEPWLDDKSLRGPAGRWVYGLHLSTADREAQRQPVVLAADPGQQAHAEYSRRAEARTPYLAPERATVRITRVPTRESSQVEDVARHLSALGLASRPDLVFGLYRVPDYLGTGFSRDRYTEWEVVHTDVAPGGAGHPPAVAWFDADERWVSRRLKEPMVHDEELALAFLLRAGIGPEYTLGISRWLRTHHVSVSSEEGDLTGSYVTGMHVWHAPHFGTDAFERLRAERPVVIEQPSGIWLEVLNVAGIRKAVAPDTGRPAEMPSPFPYLPATPQEVLGSYLDVVGVHPSDCYTATVTEDAVKDLNRVTRTAGFTVTRNVGDSLPCIDGQSRPRLRGGSRVVVAYRDRASYAEGRERFAAYQREVWQSQLQKGAERRPLELDDLADHLPRGLRGLVKGVSAVGRGIDGDTYSVLDKRPPFRYCWPPIDHR